MKVSFLEDYVIRDSRIRPFKVGAATGLFSAWETCPIVMQDRFIFDSLCCIYLFQRGKVEIILVWIVLYVVQKGWWWSINKRDWQLFLHLRAQIATYLGGGGTKSSKKTTLKELKEPLRTFSYSESTVDWAMIQPWFNCDSVMRDSNSLARGHERSLPNFDP